MSTDTEGTTAVIEYGVTEAAISKLRAKNATITKVTADNYDELKTNATELQKLRGKVEDKRVTLNADALEHQRAVNTEAKRVTKLIADIENPVKKLKTDYDTEQKAIKEAEATKEATRTSLINAAIDDIERAGQNLDGMTAADLSERLSAMAGPLPTEPAFQEFLAVAMERHESTIARITVAHGKAVVRELEEQKLKEGRDKLAKDQADADARQKIIDDENKAALDSLAADRKRFEKEQDEANQKISDDAKAAAKVIDDANQKERDDNIAKQAAADALAQRALDDEAEAEAEAEAMALAPDKLKLKHFAGRLEVIVGEAPVLEHDKARKAFDRLLAVLRASINSIDDTADRL